MKIQFQGTPDADAAADAFILAFLASRKGSPVSALQVWKSLRSRGFAPTEDRGAPQPRTAEGTAVAEIDRRLQEWLKQGLVGGEARPETFTGDRHFWTIGNSHAKG